MNKSLSPCSEGFKYLVSIKEIPKPGDYGYLDPSYNDGKSPVIVKIELERSYPDCEDRDKDSYDNVWNVEMINKSEQGKNKWDDKVHYPKSYHLSHFKNGGKIIASDNPELNLPKI